MIQFEPFTYDHAAILIGQRPWTVSRDAELLFQAFSKVITRYRLKQCIVGVDIYNVEAEALGCTVAEPDGNGSPSIARPICQAQSDIIQLGIENIEDSRFATILATASRLRETFPACDVRIPLTGPFTLASHLIGLDNLLCDLLLKGSETQASLLHLSEELLNFVDRAGKLGFQITLFESSASPPMVSPDLFHSILRPVLHHLVAEITLRTGVQPQFIMGGNTLPILDGMVSINPSYIICPIETDQSQFMIKLGQRNTGIHIRVNLPPGIFVGGSPESVILAVDHAFQLAAIVPRASIGTILPVNASPELVDVASARVDFKQGL